MSNDARKSGSLLDPLDDAYEPSEADADRVFSKIQASLAAGGAGSTGNTSSPPPVAPSASGKVGAKSGFRSSRYALALGLSCAVAVGTLVGVKLLEARTGGAPSSASSPAVPVANRAPIESKTSPVAPQERVEAVAPTGVGEPSLVERGASAPSVSVDALPKATLNAKAVDSARAPSAGAPNGDARRTAESTPSKTSGAAAHADVGPSAGDGDSLERESALLAEARQAERQGDDARALQRLEEHARTFPNGWLAADRAAERIVVLCNLGRRDEAITEAAAFLQGRPKSPLTRRIAMSCAGQP